MLQHSFESLLARITQLESQVAELQPEEAVAAASSTTETTQTTTGMTFYPVAETALTLTQDAAWHADFTAPSVIPDTAKVLVLFIYVETQGSITDNYFKVSTDYTSADIYSLLHVNVAGANVTNYGFQVHAPVGKVFDYYLDNDADFVVTAYVQGYWK